MDVFSQKRYMTLTIVLLVVLNIFTLSIIWLKEFKEPKGSLEGPRQRERTTLRFLQEELNLSDDQIKQYDRLRSEHSTQSRILMDEAHRLKEKMFRQVFKENPDTVRANQIAKMIGDRQIEMEQLTFNHFLDLKLLLGEEQKHKLQDLLDEFFRIHGPPRGPEREGPPRHPLPPGERSRDRH